MIIINENPGRSHKNKKCLDFTNKENRYNISGYCYLEYCDYNRGLVSRSILRLCKNNCIQYSSLIERRSNKPRGNHHSLNHLLHRPIKFRFMFVIAAIYMFLFAELLIRCLSVSSCFAFQVAIHKFNFFPESYKIKTLLAKQPLMKAFICVSNTSNII